MTMKFFKLGTRFPQLPFETRERYYFFSMTTNSLDKYDTSYAGGNRSKQVAVYCHASKTILIVRYSR